MSSQEKINILLIEDNQPDARLVEIYLRESPTMRFELTHVTRLSDGLKLFENNHFHLVLLDMSLPDSSGIETIKMAGKSVPHSVAIIVLTGMEDEQLGIKSVQAGAQDYLVKGQLNSGLLTRSVLHALERKRLLITLEETAQNLQISQDRLLQAQQIAKLGSYELDIRTGNMLCSAELCRIFETSTGKKGTLKTYLEFIPDIERESVNTSLLGAIQLLNKQFTIEHRIVTPLTGQTKYIINHGYATEQYGQHKVVGTMQDITEFKHTKEKLLQSEERYRTIFEESKDAIYITTVEGKLIEYNRSFMEMFGYSENEVRHLNVADLYSDQQYRNTLQQEIGQHGYVKDFESQLYRKDGDLIDCLITATAWHSVDGTLRGYHGIMRDITAQKHTQELVRAKEVAEQSARVKEQFLANMSHEIRTPLNVVIGMTHLLEQTTIDKNQQEYVAALKLSSETLLKLINNVLDFSKIESGKLELEQAPFNLQDTIRELLQTYKVNAREKKIGLYTQIDADLPELIVGDSVRLFQILNNLISNAIKYTQKGEVTIRCDVVEETADTIAIKFAVKDTGIGIPFDKQRHIFESFTQAAEETTRLYGGTGLGLSIAKKLTNLYNSDLYVDSQEGSGSLFHFTINFNKVVSFDKENLQQNKSTTQPKTNYDYNSSLAYAAGDTPYLTQQVSIADPRKIINILLVEDHKLNQIVAGDLLKKWSPNIRIDIAENGQEAILALRKGKLYDIILMDISMPIMDGYEATTYIRNQMPAPYKNIPIIAMTAHAFNKNAEKCFEVGMNEFVSKPVNPQILYSKLNKIISEFQQQDITPAGYKQESETTSKPPASQPTSPKLLNLAYLETLTGGDEEIKLIMIETLVRDLPAEVVQMENDCNAQQWEALKASAHKLKSTCAYMGLNETSEIAKQIENNAWDKTNLDKIPDWVGQVANTCREAHKELLQELNNHNVPA